MKDVLLLRLAKSCRIVSIALPMLDRLDSMSSSSDEALVEGAALSVLVVDVFDDGVLVEESLLVELPVELSSLELLLEDLPLVSVERLEAISDKSDSMVEVDFATSPSTAGVSAAGCSVAGVAGVASSAGATGTSGVTGTSGAAGVAASACGSSMVLPNWASMFFTSWLTCLLTKLLLFI